MEKEIYESNISKLKIPINVILDHYLESTPKSENNFNNNINISIARDYVCQDRQDSNKEEIKYLRII